MTNDRNWGGKRPGAGRPIAPKKARYTILVSEELHEKLKEIGAVKVREALEALVSLEGK